MGSVDRNAFIKEYSEAVRNGSAALFVGAGASHSAGYVDWKGLLAEVAEDLGLDIKRESDLVTLAQFHLNDRNGRDRLNALLVDGFQENHDPTEVHTLIASLPVHTVWTTNYDDLLERAYEAAGKRADVKRHAEDINFTRGRSNVTVYKMHGDKTRVAEAVLAKEDYETYHPKRELFSIALRGDLTQKTFLFVGVSFTDPNLAYILNRVRQLVKVDGRKHYCLLRAPQAEDYEGADYDAVRFEHFLIDLKRYNIRPVLIKDYKEIPEILRELNRRSHLRDILVSGSAAEFEPLGETRFRHLCAAIGTALIKNNFNVVSGFGLGVGSDVIMGAMQALPRNNDDRLKLWPFPQEIADATSRAKLWTEYRHRIVSEAGICLVVGGNKLEKGQVITADGVREEANITWKSGKIVLPIGATGYVAKELWDTVRQDARKYFAGADVSKQLDVLGDPASSIEQLVKAVIEIVRQLNK